MHRVGRRGILASLLAGPLIAAAQVTPGKAAPGEGSLTLYNGQHKQTGAAAAEGFEKATGIKVNVRNGESGQLASLIMEEGANSPADVFYSEETPPLVSLDEKGLLAPIDASTVSQLPARYHAKDGNWIGLTARCRVVAYNKKAIAETALPSSVLDFAKPAWRSKVAYVPTSGAFQEQIVAIELLKGQDTALQWLRGLKQYGKIYNNNVAALNGVERGEVQVALINNYYWFNLAREKGAANMQSALHYLGDQDPGALVTVSGIGILKSSKNLGNAQRFLAFLASAKGQAVITDAVAEYPLRPGVTSPFDVKPFSELDPPNITPADLGDAHDALVLESEAGLR